MPATVAPTKQKNGERCMDSTYYMRTTSTSCAINLNLSQRLAVRQSDQEGRVEIDMYRSFYL
eukprot:scaffold656_cov146-Skeletonema_menzelii.AAC.5